MPLWYVRRGEDLWAWTYAKSQKVRNLDRDPRATLQVEAGTEYHLLRGVMLETHAVVHRDLDTVTALGLEIFARHGDGDELSDEARAGRDRTGRQTGRSAVHRAQPGHLGPPQAGRGVLATMTALKGLILSGGKGTRLRPITHTSAKQLVPVANKPILFYGIEAMAAAGITRSASSSPRRDRRRDPRRRRRRLAVRRRDHLHPAGRARSASPTAVLIAEPFLGDDDFVMYLGDNLLQGGIEDLVAQRLAVRRARTR